MPKVNPIDIYIYAIIHSTRNLILEAIERNDFLNNLMDKERKDMVINAMAPASYKKDSYIINEHDEGSEFFVSAEGYYDVIQAGKHVGNFGPATVFGELAILYNAPRKATIKGKRKYRDSRRKHFKDLLSNSCHRCASLEDNARDISCHYANLRLEGARGEFTVSALCALPAGARRESAQQSCGSIAAG